MKRLGFLVIVACLATLTGAVGCQSSSKLDNMKMPPPKEAKAEVQPTLQADHSGTIEQRVTRLEDNYARYAEALDFLGKVYAQQKAQQRAQEREEAAEDAVFAVDIAPDLKNGQVEGSSSALVTVVEAWDFA